MTEPRYVCVHGHFYQPPRESPWLDAVDAEPSAAPFHDWNERITAECYAPNAAAPILDERGTLVRVVSNYATMSFNFGPTLLSWLETSAPATYAAVVRADAESRARFGGHGAAMAQAYNHLIMPLANERDQRTQARWGRRDFEHRFGRAPEGMWLSETAADTPSLEALAAEGIAFTVLAPRQCARVRKLSAKAWIDVGAGVDPSMPYRVDLPSGRSIAVFFYDGPISQGIAFEGLLHRGDHLASRLASAFDPRREHAQLAHVATDGETYGHHHRGGEMALAWALDALARRGIARPTCYAEMLARHPPTHAAEIVERTSWSCAHGVERWRSNCGCSAGGGLSQAWRGPLRAALDWLRDELAAIAEGRGRALVRDPWAARDAYVDVLLARTDEARRGWVSANAVAGASSVDVLRLGEMLRFGMLMYTSCGWFFDDLAGLEPQQVIAYAARAAELGGQLGGGDLLAGLSARLAKGASNDPEQGDGAKILARILAKRAVDATRSALHHATLSLLDTYLPEVPAIDVARCREERIETREERVVLGRAELTERATGARRDVLYAAIRRGTLDVRGAARVAADDDVAALATELEDIAAHEPDALAQAVAAIVGPLSPALDALYGDAPRAAMRSVSHGAALAEEEACALRYEGARPLLERLSALAVPPPAALAVSAEVALSSRLARRIAEGAGVDAALAIVHEATAVGVRLRPEAIEPAMLARLASAASAPSDAASIAALADAVALARALPFPARTDDARSRYLGLVVALRGTSLDPSVVAALRALGAALGMPLGDALTGLSRAASGARLALDGDRPPPLLAQLFLLARPLGARDQRRFLRGRRGQSPRRRAAERRVSPRERDRIRARPRDRWPRARRIGRDPGAPRRALSGAAADPGRSVAARADAADGRDRERRHAAAPEPLGAPPHRDRQGGSGSVGARGDRARARGARSGARARA